MKQFFEAAIRNIYSHGDTDIFPFPFENLAISDQTIKMVDLLTDGFADAKAAMINTTPNDLTSLIPVGLTGFRIASQLDPLWNCLFLASVLSIAAKIEDARLPPDRVFSYRLDKANYLGGDLFRRDIGWMQFTRASRQLAQGAEYVITCDVADCYARIGHHKLENALLMIDSPKEVRAVIMSYLSHGTATRSTGLPVGGPAARILAELALNNPDNYLRSSGIEFLRFADDFHVFCKSKRDAYRALISLSTALDNEGLTLQKSKTRILSRSEFLVVNSTLLKEDEPVTPVDRLMSLSLRYDPYTANAEENYEALKAALKEIDIIALLNDQLAQSRIHIPTTKKIVAALALIDNAAQFGAVLSMLDNMSALFSICSNIFITISAMMKNFSDSERAAISERLRKLYDDGHEVMQVPIHIAYAVRILSQDKTAANQGFLHKCYDREDSVLVRRDIAATFANWRNFPWLSIYIKKFSTLNEWERRIAIVASFGMKDEGRHWRKHNEPKFTPFESLVSEWRSDKPEQFALPL